MKNRLPDLNDHLFSALERLNDDQLEGDKLKAEIARARAVANVGITIVQGAHLALAASALALEHGLQELPTPPALIDNRNALPNGTS